MQGTSKVILGATLIMVVSLAIVLGLILVLLAELYCSLLLRRRRLRVVPPNAASTVDANPIATIANISELLPSDSNQSTTSLRSLYAHGVLSAPRNFLFPTVLNKEDQAKKQISQVFDLETQEPSLICSPSLPSPAQSLPKVFIQSKLSPSHGCNDSSSNGSDHLMYISNPIYDNEAMRPSIGETPFETPNSSPSQLETCGASGEDEIVVSSPSSSHSHSLPNTPPLTPMKKLPAEACSITLRDARSLATSGSDSNTNNDPSSSSSDSPRTSPSW